MTSPSAAPKLRTQGRFFLPAGAIVGFVAASVAVILITVLSYLALSERTRTGEQVNHTLEVQRKLANTLSLLKDAETGQRGYLLTHSQSYLEPYQQATTLVRAEISRLRSLVSDNPRQIERAELLDQVTQHKLSELAETVELGRKGLFDEALGRVNTDVGKLLMDRARQATEQLAAEEQRVLDIKTADWERTQELTTLVTLGGAGVLLALIFVAAGLSAREFKRRNDQAWLRTTQADLAANILGERSLNDMAERALQFITPALSAQVAAFYVREGDMLIRASAFADGGGSERVRMGEGLVGQVAKEGVPRDIENVPPDYVKVHSGVGSRAPVHLALIPLRAEEQTVGVLELGAFHSFAPIDLELLSNVSTSLGVAVQGSQYRTRLEQLLEETQRQSEELQAQQEELRTSNEELQEQSEALRTQQARLENQQSELEQSNSQLEEQTQALENQREELLQTQRTLAANAETLERSNLYKSEFLANMSHELRTPLNSSLILAKLLIENRQGNLLPEQVRFAETIYSSGNDLLALINDILDLSKIEAGKIDLYPEPVSLTQLIDSTRQTFDPIAKERQLSFVTRVEPGTPATMVTDVQRLRQILKNLLSNAFKFTAQGSVTLTCASTADGRMAFSVKDTGIGIPAHQQEIVFEAFRQADGTTNRKYGGTGLGLSISRDLARRLGGDIALASTEGAGSTFTLELPIVMPDQATQIVPAKRLPLPAPTPSSTPPASKVSAPTGEASLPEPPFPDDRHARTRGPRLILTIEDDLSFARILYDLAHELDFDCVVAGNARDGIALARALNPSAVLLDVGLPDDSGLSVLERLKRDPATRHVPIHVISAFDYTQTALELGAVGFAIKPVKRDELVEAIKKLEQKMTQKMRRVLVAEDDAALRANITALIGADEVQVIGVGTVREALSELERSTFDCMIMDLTLPDASGYELLEKMAESRQYSFPPVIVYTGRSLSRDEEQHLRRYSKSIIIKGARSPDRLLDEVTLFLHQIEANLPSDQQRMLKESRHRDKSFEDRRILVVEDDARNIFALSSILEPQGATVEIARNGREAVERLKRAHDIDLVLMDIMMPEMDGLQATEEIRKIPELRKVPIIALTAKAMRDDHERCLAAGANDYIAKPIDVDKLLSLCRVWLPK